MSRTKAEVRAFLDSLVGTIVVHPGYPSLNGQCVTLTKALMEFLGVPNPYAARGDAINAGDTYIRQGLGTEGKGWLTIVVNRDMGYIDGVHYGHIWVDLSGEANYESNGARALFTTKNTRPISQGQQFINFDKWIKEEDDMSDVADNYFVQACAEGLLGRTAAGDQNLLNNVGRPKTDVLDTVRFYPEATDRLKKANNYDKDVKAAYEKGKAEGGGGGNCTADERAYLDAMYKVVNKKG